MLVLRPGRPRRAAGGAALLALGPCLGGCTEAPPATGAWIYLALATAALAAAGYLLGAWRARAAHAAELRRCRAELRLWSQLQPDWIWETDAAHRLLAWHGPEQAPGTAAHGLESGGMLPPALTDRLRSQRAFAGLRSRADPALAGSFGWEWRGVPRYDESGAFGGFAGSAHPTDADDALQACAAALTPALDARSAPALVAWRAGKRWRLLHGNAAAMALWPALPTVGDLGAALAALPAPVVEACHDLAAGADLEVAGWQVWALGGLPEDVRAVVLAQQAAAAPPATAMATEANEGDTFSFTVSHDLRAPIRVVEGFTRIVKEDYGRLLDRVGNDHLDRVLAAAARMNLMIDALLTLARLSSQPLAHQPVNLSQLAAWVVDDLRRGAPERVAEVEVEPGLAVHGDPTLLRQVLENLLGNAWKYSARRERTQISFRRVVQDGREVYEVRDNGAGFDMRSAERLFGLFQRLHSASDFPGHGVGLASVRRIVRRHGGDIWADAEAGRGAAFFFTLG